jgi:long-chain acyl-CoA synthetase
LKENKKMDDIDYDKISYDDLYRNKTMEDEIVKDCDIIGRKLGLKGFELPKKIRIIKEPFSPNNGLMTSTMKLKSKNIKNKYNDELKKMYVDNL